MKRLITYSLIVATIILPLSFLKGFLSGIIERNEKAYIESSDLFVEGGLEYGTPKYNKDTLLVIEQDMMTGKSKVVYRKKGWDGEFK